MTKLTRYWISFDVSEIKEKLSDSNLVLGCGVSAYTEEDAIFLFKDKIVQNQQMPEIKSIVSDVDVSTLDKGHVISNMGVVSIRGIWFPKKYS